MKKVTASFTIAPTSSLYGGEAPNLCWMSKPDTKKVWHQNSGWYTCRETFASQLKHFVRTMKVKPATSSQWPQSRKPIDMRRLRFAMCYKTNGPKGAARDRRVLNQDQAIKRGLKLVRMLERRAGWVQTQIYKPSNNASHQNFGANVFIISASSRWMRSSQLLSLLLLCLRFGACKDLAKLKRIDHLSAFLKKVKQSGAYSGDITFFKNAGKYILPIMDNVQSLFMWQSTVKFWSKQLGSYGVDRMVRGNGTGVDTLNKRFAKLKSEVDGK